MSADTQRGEREPNRRAAPLPPLTDAEAQSLRRAVDAARAAGDRVVRVDMRRAPIVQREHLETIRP